MAFCISASGYSSAQAASSQWRALARHRLLAKHVRRDKHGGRHLPLAPASSSQRKAATLSARAAHAVLEHQPQVVGGRAAALPSRLLEQRSRLRQRPPRPNASAPWPAPPVPRDAIPCLRTTATAASITATSNGLELHFARSIWYRANPLPAHRQACNTDTLSRPAAGATSSPPPPNGTPPGAVCSLAKCQLRAAPFARGQRLGFADKGDQHIAIGVRRRDDGLAAIKAGETATATGAVVIGRDQKFLLPSPGLPR